MLNKYFHYKRKKKHTALFTKKKTFCLLVYSNCRSKKTITVKKSESVRERESVTERERGEVQRRITQ